MKKTEVIDLFCGVGGLTYGLQEAGLNVVAGIDTDSSCKFSYETNNNTPFIHKNICEVTTSDLDVYFNDDCIKILVGCAPCQPFSSQAFKYKAHEKHKDRELLIEFLRIIKEMKPDIVSMENVPAIKKQNVFNIFEKELKNLGYNVNWSVVSSAKYGIPQIRNRLVLLASKLGEINLIPYTHNEDNYVTVRDVISKLSPIKAGEVHSKDPLHRSCSLSDLNIKRLKSSKQGGTWRDWDISLLPNCYKKESGRGYSGVYGRASWDKPSITITTQFTTYSSGRFGHPEQDRALSLREGALLQTFPENYNFIEDANNISISRIKRQIGNAVPPKLGKVIGKSILKHLGVANATKRI